MLWASPKDLGMKVIIFFFIINSWLFPKLGYVGPSSNELSLIPLVHTTISNAPSFWYANREVKRKFERDIGEEEMIWERRSVVELLLQTTRGWTVAVVWGNSVRIIGVSSEKNIIVLKHSGLNFLTVLGGLSKLLPTLFESNSFTKRVRKHIKIIILKIF